MHGIKLNGFTEASPVFVKGVSLFTAMPESVITVGTNNIVYICRLEKLLIITKEISKACILSTRQLMNVDNFMYFHCFLKDLTAITKNRVHHTNMC